MVFAAKTRMAVEDRYFVDGGAVIVVICSTRSTTLEIV